MRHSSTKKLTLSAFLCALSTGALWGATSLPSGTLALLCLASCLSAVCFWECGNKYGLIQYCAVSLLAFLLLPKTASILAYIFFLGYYPYVREKVKNILFRAGIFTIVYILAFYLFKNLLLAGFNAQIYHYILWLTGGEIVFFIFDYAISCFKIFYKERFSFLNK